AVASIMDMVGNRLDVVVNERIDEALLWIGVILLVRARFCDVDVVMLPALALVARALNHVPQVRDDARFNNALTVLIEIDTPGIARAFGENFELVFGRMVPPHRRIHALA